MSGVANSRYGRGSRENASRVVVIMPKEETDAVDNWGVPAGMTSRTSAIRFLLRKGLEAVRAEETRL